MYVTFAKGKDLQDWRKSKKLFVSYRLFKKKSRGTCGEIGNYWLDVAIQEDRQSGQTSEIIMTKKKCWNWRKTPNKTKLEVKEIYF